MVVSQRDLIRQELANILGLTAGRKDISPDTPVLPYYHGPDSIFGSLAGVSDTFISTVIQPVGLGSVLPAFGTVYATPEYGYITGFSAATGTNPDGVCDDAKQAGPVITCLQTAHFGRYRLDSRPLEINHVGMQRNAADPTNLRVLNMPLMTNLGGMTPQSAYNSGDAMFQPKNEMLARMAEMAHEIGDILMKQVWFGDPANHTSGGGYDEFPGLNMLIGTTKLDSRSGIPCEGLRSDIKSFGNKRVTDNGGQDIMDAIRNIVWTRKFIAARTNMGAVRWVFVMRENAFRQVSEIWPCAYATTGCGFATNSSADPSLTVGGFEQIRFRDSMVAGQYLPVDGVNYDVIFDDAIPEDSLGSGCFASDIYFIPLTVKGNIPVLYWEYLDYTKGAMIAAEQGRYAPGTFWTDQGRYLWWNKPNNNVCIQLGMKTEPRLIFLTPHLAGRITDVAYCSTQHAPDPFRSDLYYPDDFGMGVRTRSGLYSPWNPTTPGF